MAMTWVHSNAKRIQRMRQMGKITQVDYELDLKKGYTIRFFDADQRKLILKIPRQDKIWNELLIGENKVIFNLMVHRLFNENGINCPYWYPYDVDDIDSLLGDISVMFQLKRLNKLNEFNFPCTQMVVRKRERRWKQKQ